LIHPYEVRHLTISEIKLMSSFPEGFKLEGKFTEKWARVGNSVPPLFMRAIALHIRQEILPHAMMAGCVA
jgi:DNA (cytosine-5)-methyltransferase 1